MKKPMFAKRHYKALATAIGQASREGKPTESAIVDLLEADNPRFRAVDFVRAIENQIKEGN